MHLQQHTEIVVGFRIIVPRGHRGAIGSHCAINVALLLQGIAERQKSFGVVRIELDRLPVRGNRIREPALLLQHRSKIVVGCRIGRLQPDPLAKQPLRRCKIALLRRNDRQIAIGSRVGGIDVEERSIKPLRIDDQTPPLRCERIVQQLLRRWMSHGVVRLKPAGNQSGCR